jgi:hypothetical protein
MFMSCSARCLKIEAAESLRHAEVDRALRRSMLIRLASRKNNIAQGTARSTKPETTIAKKFIAPSLTRRCKP